jgi:hypothetical protein
MLIEPNLAEGNSRCPRCPGAWERLERLKHLRDLKGALHHLAPSLSAGQG